MREKGRNRERKNEVAREYEGAQESVRGGEH